MKRRIVAAAVAAALSGAAFAENMNLDVGASGTLFDVTEANADMTYAVDPFANFAYSMKLSNGMGLKLFLNSDAVIRSFKSGDDDETGTSAQFNPGATLTSGDLTATLSLPQLINTPASDDEKWGAKTVDSKGVGYYAAMNYDESFFSTAYAKVAYKIAAAEKITVTPAVETEIVFLPEAGVASLKPAVSVAYDIVVFDAKGSLYLLPEDYDEDNDFYFFADPKVAVKLDSVVKGLSTSLAASIPLTETETLGTSITPAVAYKLNAFAVSFDLKLNKLFMDEDLNTDMQLEPKLKLTYGFKF